MSIDDLDKKIAKHKLEFKYRKFVLSMLNTAKACRGGRGQHYASNVVFGVSTCVGIAPTLPSSDEYLINCYKYKLIIGYDAEERDFKNSHFEKLCSYVMVLTEQSEFDKRPPFEWMELVNDKSHYRDNGYMCRSWYIK